MRTHGRLVAFARAVLGGLGHVLVAVGVLATIYPVLVTGTASVPVSATGLLTSLDRLVHAVVVSAGIPTLAVDLSPSSARFAGAAIIALGWMIVVTSQWSVIQRRASRWSALPGRADESTS